MGDDDPIAPLANGRLLASRIPNARLHVVTGGGHLFLLEQLPLFGVVPDDPAAAAVYAEGAPPGRATARSPLLRAARAVAAALLTVPENPGPAAAPSTPVGAGRG